MKVKECMCNNVLYCKPETTINDVAKQMNQNHIGCMPVCDNNNNLVGLVTDRDIILRAVACDKNTVTTPVSEIMTTKIYSCDSNAELSEATKLMSDMQIKRVPVLDNGKVIGIITLGDLANNEEVSGKTVNQILENICNCNVNAKNNY